MSAGVGRLEAAARRANSVLKGLGAVGKMGVYYDPSSLDGESLDLVVRTSIPEELAPGEARRLGRALYMIGMIAEEARDATWAPEGGEDFFKD